MLLAALEIKKNDTGEGQQQIVRPKYSEMESMTARQRSMGVLGTAQAIADHC
jgi:hypothetical protein